MMAAVRFLKNFGRHAEEAYGSRIGTPRCIIHVAAVCRNVCGVTLPMQRASFIALSNPLFTDLIGFPLNSTKPTLCQL